MPLDRTIQELEARLPDLRHLLADGEMVLATSESAALLADELETLLGRADTVARRLRQLLLGGSLSDVMRQEAVAPAPALPAPIESDIAPAPPMAAEDAPSDARGGMEAWSDMDEDLARALGLLPEEEPSSEQVRGRRKLDELRERFGVAGTSMSGGEIAAERELDALEEELGIDDAARRVYIEELEGLARQVITDQEQINNLWRELGLDRLGGADEDSPDDTPGGAAVGARVTPPLQPRDPRAGRTFEAAEEPPRNS